MIRLRYLVGRTVAGALLFFAKVWSRSGQAGMTGQAAEAN